MTEQDNNNAKGTPKQVNIIRTPRDRPYVSIARQTLQDGKRSPDGLSFAARGLLGYLLSKPDGWIVQIDDIKKEGGVGRDKALSLMTELRDAGYVVTIIVKDDDGRFVGKIDQVFETYQIEHRHRHTEKPDDGKPVSRRNRAIYSNESVDSTEGLDKNTGHTPSGSAGGSPVTPPLLGKDDDQGPKNERVKEEPIYDAIERRVFGQVVGNHIPRNWNAPVGGIARWLKGEIGNYRLYKVGKLDRPATLTELDQFIDWYNTDTKGKALPQDFNKFVTHWRRWQASTTPVIPSGQSSTPTQTPPRPTGNALKKMMTGKASDDE